MNEQTKTEIDILKKDLENRFAEIMFHSQRYHSQTNLVYLYLSAVVSLAAISYSDEAQKLFQNLSQSELKFVFMIVLTIGAIVQYYLGSLLLDSLYMIYANGGRIASIEKEINERLGVKVLKWDSEIIPKMYDMKYWQYKTWIKPGYIVSAWALLIWAINASSLIILWERIIGEYFLVFSVLIAVATFFHAYQWVVLQIFGIEFITKVINGEPLINKTTNSQSSRIKVFAPILTLFLGIIPFVILSIQTSSFWFDSKYNFPLMTLPSIWIGDTFLLPTLNYFIASSFLYSENLIRIHKKQILIIFILSFLVSLAINAYTHYSWVQDNYTGFMDTVIGELSTAGWWHFGFSVLQMAIIFSFFGAWVVFAKEAKIEILINFEKTWKIFIIFTSISILDLISKNVFVFKTSISSINLLREMSSFITLFFSGLVFVVMLAYRQNRQAKKRKTA